jgi:hypothetical protein
MKKLIITSAIILAMATATWATPCHIKLCNGSTMLMTTGSKVNMELETCSSTSGANIFMILRILGVI